MSKWFEVPVTIYKVYAVEIADDETRDDAARYAMDDVLGEYSETGKIVEASSMYTAKQIKRHADEVLSL